MRNSLQDFLRWWLAELAGLVPRSIANLFAANLINYRLSLMNGQWQLTHSAKPSSDGATILSGSWIEIQDRVISRLRRFGPLVGVQIIIPTDLCLIREIAIPAAAVRRARDIAVLDLEHATPFNLSNAYVGHRLQPTPDEVVLVRQIVAKRALLGGPFDELQAHRIGVQQIIALGDDEPGGIELSGQQPAHRSRLERLMSVAAIALLIITVGLAVTLASVALDNQARGLVSGATRLQAIRQEALALDRVRQSDTQRRIKARSVVEQRLQTVTALDIWSEVTRILPDTVWIKQFRLSQKTLHLVGEAASPEELIKRLTQSSMFENARFTSELVTTHSTNRVQFQLQLDIAAHPVAKAGPVAKVSTK